MRIAFAALLLLLAVPTLAAEIYQTEDASGAPVFTDQPGTQPARPVQLGKGNVFDASEADGQISGDDADRAENRAPSTATDDDDDDSKPTPPVTPGSYAVELLSPTNDETVRENAGNVVFRVSITPDLSASHRAVLMIDGEAAGAGFSGGLFTTQNMDRGTHTAEVRVVQPGTGKVIGSSQRVTFHLLRVSVLHNRPGDDQIAQRPALVQWLLSLL